MRVCLYKSVRLRLFLLACACLDCLSVQVCPFVCSSSSNQCDAQVAERDAGFYSFYIVGVVNRSSHEKCNTTTEAISYTWTTRSRAIMRFPRASKNNMEKQIPRTKTYEPPGWQVRLSLTMLRSDNSQGPQPTCSHTDVKLPLWLD